MKLFNAVQLVVLFACMPFIIGWLGTNPFSYSKGLMCLAGFGYLVEAVILVAALRVQMEA